MSSRMMSEVPSSISSSLASRIHCSTGCSREYPQPPRVCTAAQVQNIAVSERSEERRVGKESRSGWSPDHGKQKSNRERNTARKKKARLPRSDRQLGGESGDKW